VITVVAVVRGDRLSGNNKQIIIVNYHLSRDNDEKILSALSVVRSRIFRPVLSSSSVRRVVHGNPTVQHARVPSRPPITMVSDVCAVYVVDGELAATVR
jgi:hypothetical protein